MSETYNVYNYIKINVIFKRKTFLFLLILKTFMPNYDLEYSSCTIRERIKRKK